MLDHCKVSMVQSSLEGVTFYAQAALQRGDLTTLGVDVPEDKRRQHLAQVHFAHGVFYLAFQVFGAQRG